MKQFLIALLIFLVWSFFGLWLYSTLKTPEMGEAIAVNDEENTELLEDLETKVDSTEVDSIADIKITGKSTFDENSFKAMTNEGDLVFLYDEGVEIQKNSSELQISEGAIDFKYKLNTYLVEHPDQELHILAYYDPSENLETPNFGEQRGIRMINLLAQVGILRERMVIKPTIKKMEFDTLGKNENGIGFVFRPLNEERLKSPRYRIPATRAVYPKFVNGNIYANQDLKDLVPEMQQVLQSNPNITVEIIGHTDNVGNGQDNYLVGLKYAQQARWYLINKGNLDKKRIKALSKGESEPIADNNYKAGRNENRRIEVKYISN